MFNWPTAFPRQVDKLPNLDQIDEIGRHGVESSLTAVLPDDSGSKV
jgi:hypothetical protein